MKWLFAVAISLLAVAAQAVAVQALDVPAAPPLNRPIIDQTGTLNQAQIDALAKQINDSRTQKSYQLGILMIPTLEDRAIEDYSLDVARKWGIGEKGKNNGALLIIAKNDRKLRIEVGSGLEGELTDAESGRIIRNTITPQFKENKFFEGITAGVASIQAQVEGRAVPEADGEEASEFDIASIIFMLFVFGGSAISWLASVLARSKSWWAGGAVGGVSAGILAFASGWVLWSLLTIPILIIGGLLLDFFVSRNFIQHKKRGDDPSWWAGGGWMGDSGGSSGGGSFGGGGFSGGGSSGGW